MKTRRIHLVTGIAYPEIGGPAMYVRELEKSLRNRGIETKVTSYLPWERRLPSGVRHLFLFIRVLSLSFRSDQIWAFDTYASGFPAYMAAKFLRKPFLVRVGGDFLWEHYVNRTGESIILSEFYTSLHRLNYKEKIIFTLTRKLIRGAVYVIFSTKWQKQIWNVPYSLPEERTFIIENAYSIKPRYTESRTGVFVSPSRDTKVKNKNMLRDIFSEIKQIFPAIELDEEGMSHELHIKRLQHAYAVIIPSLSEVSPNLLLDALACGKPFIATQDCGYYEKFKACGIFCDTRNKQELKKAILSLSDPNTYAAYSDAIKTILWQRSYDDVCNDFLRITRV